MRKKQRTHDEFVLDIEAINPNLKICSVFTTVAQRIDVECKKCGHKWSPISGSLLHGTGCPKCKKIFNKITHDEFLEKLKNKSPTIKLLSTYINSKEKVQCECKVCGYIWTSTPDFLMRSKSGVCPNCSKRESANNRKKSNDKFIKELALVNYNIEPLTEYIYAKSKIDCRCKVCGHEWSSKPNHLLAGHGCPQCKESVGEKIIFGFLVDKNIIFERQKTFQNLLGVGGRNLRYDFYIPSYNLLIEFNGRQHDKPVNFNGIDDGRAVEKFKILQANYEIKREWAKRNNIEFFEIWHYDLKNIERILNKKFFNL